MGGPLLYSIVQINKLYTGWLNAGFFSQINKDRLCCVNIESKAQNTSPYRMPIIAPYFPHHDSHPFGILFDSQRPSLQLLLTLVFFWYGFYVFYMNSSADWWMCYPNNINVKFILTKTAFLFSFQKGIGGLTKLV